MNKEGCLSLISSHLEGESHLTWLCTSRNFWELLGSVGALGRWRSSAGCSLECHQGRLEEIHAGAQLILSVGDQQGEGAGNLAEKPFLPHREALICYANCSCLPPPWTSPPNVGIWRWTWHHIICDSCSVWGAVGCSERGR